MNSNITSGKWNEFKGDLQKTWGKITGDEFEQTKGDITKIKGLVQKKIGLSQDEAAKKVNALAEKYMANQTKDFSKPYSSTSAEEQDRQDSF